MSEFSQRLIHWQRQHGRHHLPWQNTGNPYFVWLSEIMLQQTQVSTVIPYFQRFVERFPTIADLAAAPESDVLGLWSGLGYYARARHLHRAAQELVLHYQGELPRQSQELAQLPGIGRSTAAAIAAFSWNERAAILDGNVRRVLCRCFGIYGYPGDKKVSDQLWALAESLLPSQAEDMPTYTQGLMDLGASLCARRKPNCAACPMHSHCYAAQNHVTAQLPTPKPKKERPVRSETLLILCHQGGVWLEQRPPLGIWGGLWSPPVLPEGQDAALWLAEHWGLQVSGWQDLAELSHDFSHFQLRIQPRLGQVSAIQPGVRSDSLQWLPLAQQDEERFQNAPLPAPIRKLLSELP